MGTDRRRLPRRAFSIDGRRIGLGHPCLLIGEVAQAHEGSLGMAHAFIDAIADAGADAVKFQTHIAAAESTADEAFRVPFSRQDPSRYEYWRRMEFTREQWAGLLRHAEARGLIFLSSPFSIEAVDLLRACGVKAWKVASGEICHWQLIEEMARTRKPVILSTGMATWKEIRRAVHRVRSFHAPLAVLQCTSKYPTAPEDVGLQLIPVLRRRFGCVVGLSDHSGTVVSGILAAATGADIVEVHVTLSRKLIGPDVAASITSEELAQLVRGVRFAERMNGGLPNKDAVARRLAAMRRTFFHSIVAGRRLRAGEVLRREDLKFKKPGTGLPPEAVGEAIGRVLLRDLPVDARLRIADLGTVAAARKRAAGDRTAASRRRARARGQRATTMDG